MYWTSIMSEFTVTQADVDKLLDEAQIQEHIFWDKELCVSYKLANGFTILGRAACVDPANFNYDIGRRVARESASNQLWPILGYLMQQRLADKGI